jgi:O-antigen/teichoic acid export membrane protein
VAAVELRQSVVRGLAWNVSGQAAMQISRFAVAIVLARLLTPHAYGLAGMVVVISGLTLVFSDVTLGVALIQRERITETDRSTMFWTSCAIGLAATGVGVAISSWVADFYGEPAVRALFAVFSVTFVLTAVGTTQATLLQRAMDFRGLQIRTIAATVVGGVAGIVAAATGLGAWSIITQLLVGNLLSTILLWRFSPWRPSFTYSFTSLRTLGASGIRLVGARVFFYVGGNADNVLVGRFLGSAALGIYALAYNLMLLPLSRLVYPIQQTLLPALSRIQDDPERIVRLWLRANRIVAALVVPVLVGMAVVAPDLVSVVLGRRWERLVPVLQILTAAAIVQSLGSLSTSILVAVGRSGSLFRFSILSSALQVAAFAIGLHWGLKGVAFCYVLANVVVVPILVQMTSRALGLAPIKIAQNLVGVAGAVLLMAAVTVSLRAGLVHLGVAAPLRLGAVVVAGIAVYLVLCAWLVPELGDQIGPLIRGPVGWMERRRDGAQEAS